MTVGTDSPRDNQSISIAAPQSTPLLRPTAESLAFPDSLIIDYFGPIQIFMAEYQIELISL